ncbi:MAG: hypothetical protein FJ096_15790 [Deltaproteobacteria bacterium]|nr:hypothetical protein [Deltaproteobacteria bacterium]
MASPETRRPHVLPWAAGLLGAGAVLLELASFRLDSAIFGWGYARLLAAVAPALGGLTGAAIAARTLAGDPRDRSVGVAANGASVAGAAAGLSAIALTWSSQRYAKLDGAPLAFVVPLVAWWFVSAGLVTAVAAMLRAVPEALGRTLFAFAIGGASAALLSPVAMALGCPRTLLAVGFLCAAASWLLVAGTTTPVNRAFLATVPLALLSLSLGDTRNPWLKVRTDVGRKGRVGLTTWSQHGLFQVDQGKAGILNYTVDRAAPRPLALADKAKRRQAFELPDIAYFMGPTSGAALVVGAGGAREIREALDAGHPRVDAVEVTSTFMRAYSAEFARELGGLLEPADRLTLRFGDPVALLPHLRESYERIVVVADPSLEPLSTRFLVDAARSHTVETVRAYLAHLAEERGILVLRAPRRELADLLATVEVALGSAAGGGEPAEFPGLRQRAVACAERKDEGFAGLLVAGRALAGPERQNLEKSCKRKGLTVEFPVEEARNGDRDRDAKQQDVEKTTARLAGGTVLTDDRPFFDAPPSVARLRDAARDSIRGLRQVEPVKAKARDEGKDEPKPEAPRISGIGIATSTAAVTLMALLLVLVIPVARGAGGGLPLGLRAGTPWLAGAVGGAGVLVNDAALRLLGGVDAAWCIVVPTSTVALGAGWLLADVMDRRRAVRGFVVAALLAVALLVGVGLAGTRFPRVGVAPLPVRFSVAFALLTVVGGVLGATLGAALRAAARVTSAGVAWLWGAYIAASAVGAATAQVVVRYVGVSKGMTVAAVLLGFGALQATVGGLRRRSGVDTPA